MSCECVICGACGGKGNVWYAFPGPDLGGEYLGDHRCDDLDEMDTCQECGGSGICETCYKCQAARDQEE